MEKMAYIPPWSCLATHLRLLCRFMKLATRVKLFPKKKIILLPTFVHIIVVLYKFTHLHELKLPINLKVVSAGGSKTQKSLGELIMLNLRSLKQPLSLAHGHRHRGPGGCSPQGAPSRNGICSVIAQAKLPCGCSRWEPDGNTHSLWNQP